MGKRIISAAACIFLVFIIISIPAGNEPDGRACTSISQSPQESKCFADSMTGRQYGAVNDLVQKNVINQKEDMQDNKWKIEPDAPGEGAIGGNLYNSGHCIEENGCIYTTNLGYYGGEEPEDNSSYTIYRLKESGWEVFVTHPIEERNEKGYIIYERYIWNLTYYKGYLYYILVDNFDPSLGGAKYYYLYRVSEKSGKAEKLADCFCRFYIYRDKIYYGTQNSPDNIRFFWEMNLDGSDRKLTYFKMPESYSEGEDYAVGGGSLYWADDKNRIRAVNLETKKEKIFAVNLGGIDGLYYENGSLYICGYDYGSDLYQLDLNTGDIKKIVSERYRSAWIHEGYLYYIEYKYDEETDIVHRDFKRRDLTTGEVITWYEMESSSEFSWSGHLEIAGNHIMVRTTVSRYRVDRIYRYKHDYFMMEIGEIK